MRWILALALALGLSSAQAQQTTIPATQATVSVTGSVGNQQVVAPLTGLRPYLTAILLVPVATSTVQFIAGTGGACAGGTVNLTGVMTFPAGQEVSLGNGYGAVLVGGLSQGICIVIGTAVAPGVVGIAQF